MRTPLVRSSLAALLMALCMLAAALTAIGGPARAATPAQAPAPAPGPVLLTLTPGAGEATARTSPKMFAALQRDLRLTRAEAITRIGRQHASGQVEARARAAAGPHFAGSWMNDDGSALMVAVTDQRVAAAVRAAGATPTEVAHRRGELEMARLKLNDRKDRLPVTSVYGWHVDPSRNRLVVSVAPGQHQTAAKWIAAAGVQADLVAYETSERPEALAADVRAGDSFESPRAGCTAGFGAVPPVGSNGFVTAGHCTFNGDPIRIGGSEVGLTMRSSFPTTRGPDRAFVRLDVNNQPVPLMRTNAGDITVLGSQAAKPGDMICRYGRTSKFRCGKLIETNKNVPATLSEGGTTTTITLLGVNRASYCVDPGDSGGPVISAMGGQAQGTITSGQPCNVSADGPSSYQPINDSLLALTLKLLVPTGQPGGPVIPGPSIAIFFCDAFGDYYDAFFSCDIYWDGGTDPDQVSISSNGSQARRINDFDGNYVFISGKCSPYQDTYVSVSVYDALNRSASDTRSSFCPR